jgi:hypothetical protein
MKWKKIVKESNIDWTAELAAQMQKDPNGVADTINCLLTGLVSLKNPNAVLNAIKTAPVGSASRNILTNMFNNVSGAAQPQG